MFVERPGHVAQHLGVALISFGLSGKQFSGTVSDKARHIGDAGSVSRSSSDHETGVRADLVNRQHPAVVTGLFREPREQHVE